MCWVSMLGLRGIGEKLRWKRAMSQATGWADYNLQRRTMSYANHTETDAR